MEKQLKYLFSLIESERPESQIIAWVDSQDNATEIYKWFQKFMEGYTTQPKQK